MDLLARLIIVALAGIGMAIVLVEKKNQWPATWLRPYISKFLGLIYHKLPEMLECGICTSFWTTLVADLIFSAYTRFTYWPLWPLSGFVAVTILWIAIEFLNAIDGISAAIESPPDSK